jgi:CBS domain-containing protein
LRDSPDVISRRAGDDPAMNTIPNRSEKHPVELEAATVGDVMTRRVIACAPEAPLRAVAGLMAMNRVHAIFVFRHIDEDDEAQQLWAVVSDLDLVAATGSDLDTLTAGSTAVTPLVTIASDCPLAMAGSLMAQHGIAHLAVTDPMSRRPVGVISTLDIARAIAVG